MHWILLRHHQQLSPFPDDKKDFNLNWTDWSVTQRCAEALMAILKSFCTVSLDGFFVDAAGGMGWAHNAMADPEWDSFVAGNASGDGVLVFGRVTYQMMESYWPSPLAKQRDPVVAGHMNRLKKVVFSRTLTEARWNNTTLMASELLPAMKKLKREANDLVILGSGNLVSQLAAAGLMDAYQMVVAPVVIGKGRTLFQTVTTPIPLTRTRVRSFANGNVVLDYQPA